MAKPTSAECQLRWGRHCPAHSVGWCGRHERCHGRPRWRWAGHAARTANRFPEKWLAEAVGWRHWGGQDVVPGGEPGFGETRLVGIVSWKLWFESWVDMFRSGEGIGPDVDNGEEQQESTAFTASWRRKGPRNCQAPCSHNGADALGSWGPQGSSLGCGLKGRGRLQRNDPSAVVHRYRLTRDAQARGTGGSEQV